MEIVPLKKICSTLGRKKHVNILTTKILEIFNTISCSEFRTKSENGKIDHWTIIRHPQPELVRTLRPYLSIICLYLESQR